MSYMFYKCRAIEEIIITKFSIDKVKTMKCMLFKCSKKMEAKIREFNKNIRYECFEEI